MLRGKRLFLLCLILLLAVACASKPVTKMESWEDAGKTWHYVITLGDTQRQAVTKDVYAEIYGYWTNLKLGEYLECDLGKTLESKLADSVECTVGNWEVE